MALQQLRRSAHQISGDPREEHRVQQVMISAGGFAAHSKAC